MPSNRIDAHRDPREQSEHEKGEHGEDGDQDVRERVHVVLQVAATATAIRVTIQVT